MPNYYSEKIFGYYLYFTSKCVIEAMHVHADKAHSQKTAAKFFVRKDGSTIVKKQGVLSNETLKKIQGFIAENHQDMFRIWQMYSQKAYYGSNSSD